MATKRLSEDVIRKATCPTGKGQEFLWEAAPTWAGLGLRVSAGGKKSFVFRESTGGRETRRTLGTWPALDLAAARAAVEGLAKGERPAGLAMVADLCRAVLAKQAERGRSAASLRMYRDAMEHLEQALGSRSVASIRLEDIAALHKAGKAHPVMANRRLACFRFAFRLAPGFGMLAPGAPNPAATAPGFLEPFPENRQRGSALTGEESARLGKALAKEEAGLWKTAMLVYLMSGARPGEICKIRWSELRGRIVELGQSKTGPRRLYLGPVAARLIEAMPRTSGEDFIFSTKPGAPIFDLGPIWDGLRVRAKLPASVRLYDCGRHSFVTACDAADVPDHRARAIAGHSEDVRDAHARYRHSSPDQLLADAERIEATILQALGIDPTSL